MLFHYDAILFSINVILKKSIKNYVYKIPSSLLFIRTFLV